MKNWIGLSIAVSLALVAGLLNWKYLERKSREVEMVSFLALGKDVQLKKGDKFLEHHFVRLNIPRKNVGNLEVTAVKYDDRLTVVSLSAVHDYLGGEIILHQELNTQPAVLMLEKGELMRFVKVNPASFVASLVKPGDFVFFVMPKYSESPKQRPPTNGPDGVGQPDSVGNFEYEDGPVRDDPQVPKIELIGPFRVLALGSRLGSYEGAISKGRSRANENVITIAVRKRGLGVEPMAEKLFQWIERPNFRHAGVVLDKSPAK